MLSPQPSIIPRPTEISTGRAAFTLAGTTGLYAPDAPDVAALLRDLLEPATGFRLPPAPSPGPDVIALVVDRSDTDLGAEGYRLTAGTTGVTATATGPAGLRWAVQTLRQLLPIAVYGKEIRTDVAWTVPATTLRDVPRYPWRGVMLDVGRWYKPVEWLYTVVDLLALHRMNTLHLHLTDDQGWRFEVRRHPRLTEVGAYRRESPLGHACDNVRDGEPHGGFYTQDELRGLVGYAARRGVTVVPEIDLPGHTQAAIAAYPRLGNDPATPLEVWTHFGVSRHILNVEEATVRFMCDVLDELVDVFPSPYVHLGGDEVLPDEWLASPAARARMAELGRTDPEDLVGWWIRRLGTHLAGAGRRLVAWDELADHDAPDRTVIMAWRNQARVRAALSAGFDVVAAPHTAMYLNYPESRAPGEPLSIGDGPVPGFRGPLSLAQVYAYDPEPIDLPADRTGRVIGVQGNLWTEYAPTPARAEYDLMPRLAAVAEIGWGGPRDELDLRRRLVTHLRRLDAAGIAYRPLDPS